MDISEIAILLLFGFAIIFGLVTTAMDLIGTSIYDINEIKKNKFWDKNKHKKHYKTRPLISVIIPAFNEERVIKRCLKSILASSYRKWEIIVVDDKSSDKTAKIVKEFMSQYPKQAIRVVSKRINSGRGGAINSGAMRFAKGEIIMALDADSVLSKHSLRNGVRQFLLNSKLVALAPNVRIMKGATILGLVQKYEYLSMFRSKKLNTLLNAEYIIGGSGAMYRRNTFRKVGGMDEHMWTEDIAMSLKIASKGNKQHLMQYASDVLVFTEPVPTYFGLFKQRYRWKLGSLQAVFAYKNMMLSRNKIYTKTLTWYRLPLVLWAELLLLMEPVVYSYIIYVAILLGNPILFLVGWAGICFSLGFAVYSDDQLSLKQKLQFSAYIPIMYILFFILTIVQITAMFKCLLNLGKITGRDKIRGNWQPPKRLATETNT